MTHPLTAETAAHFAEIALGHVRREYPHKLDQVLEGDGDLLAPRILHPIFHGSFDWHSCVHGHWMLATLLRLYPDGSQAGQITSLFNTMLTPEKVEGELAYLRRPSSQGFERPYGWAWLLKLATALAALPDPRWSRALQPLAEAFTDRFKAFLPRADYPVRAGAHTNTAFALRLAFDYAQAFEDHDLATAIRQRALIWYGADRDAPAWEPSGDDFLSPTLVEALLMGDRRLNPEGAAWLAAFLPGLAEGRPVSLFQPARVSDRSDGKIAHLDGLNLSRAWAWNTIATWLEPPAAERARASAAAHLQASLPHVAGDYMGEHWLATYAVLALGATEASS